MATEKKVRVEVVAEVVAEWPAIAGKMDPKQAQLVAEVLRKEYPGLMFNVVPVNDKWTLAQVTVRSTDKSGRRVNNVAYNNVVISAKAASEAYKLILRKE